MKSMKVFHLSWGIEFVIEIVSVRLLGEVFDEFIVASGEG